MNKTSLSSIAILGLIYLILISCNTADESLLTPLDFRAEWVGTYEGTKSTTSIEDDIFTTPISFEVTLDEDSSDALIINGTSVAIEEDGKSLDYDDENAAAAHKVHFREDGSITMKINNFFPFGLAIPCYINAKKI